VSGVLRKIISSALDWIHGSKQVIEPIGAVVLSFFAGSIFIVAIGVSPWEVAVSVATGALHGGHAVGVTLEETVPLFLSGLAFLLPFRAGFFNIGAQGHLQLGGLAAVWVTLNLNGPPALVITGAMLAAILGGMVAVAIPLIAKVYAGVNEVVTTIMFNFIWLFLVYGVVTGPMKDPTAWFGTTYPVPVSYRLPEIFLRMHAGILFIIVFAVIGYVLLRYTSFGLQMRATGLNPTAAREAGINTNRVVVVTVLISAALAGLAGGIQALGVVHRVAEGWAKPWGFLGITVGLLGGLDVLGALAAAFFLAVLETGSRHMQAMTAVPPAFIHVLQALPVLFLLAARAAKVVPKLFPAKERRSTGTLFTRERER